MASATGRLRNWWGRVLNKDPYWDSFLHRPPSDPRNLITPTILSAPGGSPFPRQAETHDPAAMSAHLKGLAKFFGADATGISALGDSERRLSPDDETEYLFAVSCLVFGVEGPKPDTGIGGQFAVQKCSVANFNVAAYIRELGYVATVRSENAAQYAVAAGLGQLDSNGRFVTPGHGPRVGLPGVVLTDLPLTPDGPMP